MYSSTASSTTTTATASTTSNWPTHTQSNILDKYGRPFWTVTTTIPIESLNRQQKCFVTCLNTEEGRMLNDGIWRPYLPNNTTPTRVTVDDIDTSQFITEYEEFLYSKLKKLQKEMKAVEKENTDLKIEI